MTPFDTSTLTPETMHRLSPDTVSNVYNGLDCCVTFEVFERLSERLASEPECVQQTYAFALDKSAPFFEMSLRGILIDQAALRKTQEELQRTLDGVKAKFAFLTKEIFGHAINANSHTQVKWLFYDYLGINPIKKRNTRGVYAPSSDEDALNRLMFNFWAEPFARYILIIRELSKKLSFLRTGLSAEGRFRTALNIAGTNTGRSSSASSAFGDGSNLQNIDTTLRYPFIADEGMILVNVDLEQADARNVGAVIWNMFCDHEDPAIAAKAADYLNACESGDTHSMVAKMSWPELEWPAEFKDWKDFCDNIDVYPGVSYRQAAKKLGHACLTADHEVLTPDGWVSISNKPPVVMEWDTGGTRFAPVSNWTDKIVECEMHSFEGTSISALMTPDHRVPYTRDTRSCVMREAPAMDGPQPNMPLGFGWEGGTEVVPARLIAAVMADGHVEQNSTRFHLAKDRKFIRLSQLCHLYGVKETVQMGGKVKIAGTYPKKPGAFMFNWTRQCLEDFLDELKYWDGTQSSTAVSISSADRETLEWFQTFGRICGIGGNIQKPQRSGFGGDCHRLQQNRRKWASGKSIKHVVLPEASTHVFCPTVPSGWFYVRRNGKIFVTGNTNYMGKPKSIAERTHIALSVVEAFQPRYFAGFPLIPLWQQKTIEEIRTTGTLITPYGRRRHFYGRGDDSETWRQAIAYRPQSMTGEQIDRGITQLWRGMPEAQLLIQVHDSILFQVPYAQHEELVPRALELLRFPVELKHGRMFEVPLEAKTGYNWGNRFDDKKTGKVDNEWGLAKWKGKDTRTPPNRKRSIRELIG
ncbi:MAG: hypothetical protein HC888_01570 [Candidatus Competibacteraceae bacterium]|nr:hypothetical protein [Candidatus Competibacteraceae bacterium]